ncbi:hypothetical protein RBG61_09920 [Paludicola sp. MB14-C6]|uniref:hypothetical protein n=1 Tax=Paludihabitans sp. MB14-C6 TaxID=3070656 RepID=UPI0027DD84F3|nr:hypothetical protein [Paludicola sp. MB14-C6]WMJ22303.1 hypothetical protein RBG61_09920 [Paludicola sp. MB14-C6]
MKTMVPLFMLPGFLTMYFVFYPMTHNTQIRTYSNLGFKRFFVENSVNPDKVQLQSPTFGYLTEFFFGFVVGLMLIVLINTIMHKSYKQLLFIRPVYWVALVVPFVIGYCDTIISFLANMHHQYCINPTTPVSVRMALPTVFIEYSFLFLVVAAFMFFVVQKIAISKPIAIISCCIALLLAPLNPYVSVLAIKLNFLKETWYVENVLGRYRYSLVLFMAVIFVLGIKSIKQSKQID